MKPSALVFDLDGTLIDSRHDIARAANRALAEAGFPTLTVDEITRYVGDGAHALMQRAAHLEADDPRANELTQSFTQAYSENPTDLTRLLPGAREALSLVERVALCTNKPRRTAQLVLERLDLIRHFEVIVTGGDLPKLKPSPEPLLFIGRALSLPPNALVMIGDGPQDIAAGRAAGTRTIGVLGLKPREELAAARPDAFLSSLCELAPTLDRWQTES